MVNIKILELAGALSAAVVSAVYVWTRQKYRQIRKMTPSPHLDKYMDSENPPFGEKLQSVLLQITTKVTRTIHRQPYSIVAEDHRYIPGLKRTRAAKKGESATKSDKSRSPLVIGTIRMGFGHHRIAYSVASYALQNTSRTDDDDGCLAATRDVYFHDVATIGDDESTLVDDAETAYSLGSRFLTELPNVLERVIAKSSSNGGPSALRMQVQVAHLMTSLIAGLDRDTPLIATHPLVGAMAVAANFTNVINLVVDNHPQWFIVVPGALNLVQGPRLYRELIKLGVPDTDLELVGHWNPRGIVETIPEATQRRMDRVTSSQPLRVLVPLGGAGAQQSFLTEFVRECLPWVQQGKVQLLLNAGDHEHMKKAFQDVLTEANVKYQFIVDVPGRDGFVDQLQQHPQQYPSHDVTLFAFNTSYAAVTTTDVLIPYTDVLVCKPSEMAFYAVPKLLIRRVGDHEAPSAVRAAELGEGTLEAATVTDAVQEVQQFLTHPGHLLAMNQMIRKNHQAGLYDGAKIAVQRALEMADDA